MPGTAIQTNDKPANAKPSENFTPVEGCLSRNFFDQSQTKNGVNNMMNNGFNDWNHEAGIPCSAVWFEANKAKTTEPCSSIDQNSIAAMNKGM